MKKLLIFLTLLSGVAVSQEAKRELINLHNDKYMEKYSYQNNNQVIICESINGRRTHCAANTRQGVNFIQQLSRLSCNHNWGYDQAGIWVENGCRAEFSVNYGWDQAGAEGNIMVCASHNFRRNYCPAFLGGRDVFLSSQLSNTSCHNNWGYDRNGVWVTNGCRAEFVIEDRYWSQNDIVICSSRNLRFQLCKANTRDGVEFVRQLSRASCNGNWGYDRQGIWVTNGCRAKFKLIKNSYGNNNGYRDTVNCYSKKRQRKVCRADTSGGVRLKKQKSRSSCRGNWGYTPNHIWVDNGCRATFQLHVNGRNDNDYHNNRPDYGNQYPNKPQNNRIICESRNLRRKTCAIPVGAKANFYKQLSKKSCRNNWGYNRKNIWVTNGCRAEFRIFK